MPFFDLTGQTAIVTGAAGGIGEAIARRLSQAGATVAIADLDAAAAATTSQSIPNSFPIEVDIANSASVKKAFDAVFARTGRVDVLVNNAGIAGKAAPITEQSDEDWQLIIGVNLVGVVNCCREALPH